MVKVVLSKDVKGVGQAGQVKEVADGYARNFLLPRKLAVLATEGAVKTAEARQAASDRRAEHEERLAREKARQMQEKPIELHAKVGDQHRLYGSITSGDIADALERQWGRAFDKRKIELAEPIRQLGSFEVPVQIHRNVVARVMVHVRPEEQV